MTFIRWRKAKGDTRLRLSAACHGGLVLDEPATHCNTAEGYFSIVKRGIVGTFHHVSPAHLPRYLNEFDFRMNTRKKLGFDDATRAAMILKGAAGKRLTYRQVG